MNEYVGAGRVQSARYFRAHAPRRAGHQYDLVPQRRILDTGFHAPTIPQRLRSVNSNDRAA